MPRASLVIFAKVPRAGEVKTRLVPPLSGEEAAVLAGAFLEDLTRRLAPVAVRRTLALPGNGPPAESTRWAPPDWGVQDQGGGDLGERLARVIAREFAAGCGPVAVVGSDHPHLPREPLRRTLEAARRGAVGWITTMDGGYACMALPRPLPGLFEGVPWGTGGVAEATREHARRDGVPLEDFGPSYDLDTAEDLDRFLADPTNARECPVTWQCLARLAPPWSVRRRTHG